MAGAMGAMNGKMTVEQIWPHKTDDQLILASKRLDEYTPAAQAVILAELQRREIGLHTAREAADPEPETRASSDETAPPRAVWSPGWLARLWRGEISLPVTFWLWGVLGNRLVFAAVAPVFEGARNPVVILGAFAGYLAYAALVSVAVWRSARRYTGPRVWRDSARLSVALGILRQIGEFFGA
jgi:hypothetical protein